MTQPYNRLLKARTMAGFRSGRSAAAAIGVKPATYASHENGTRTFSVPDAQHYADFFKVSAGWLLTGEAVSRNDFYDSRFGFQPEYPARPIDRNDPRIAEFGKKILEMAAQIMPVADAVQQDGLKTVAEVVIHRMVKDDHSPEAEQWSIVSQWKFPKDYIADILNIQPSEDAAIIVVIDDNMSPTCEVDDKLIVNFSQKKFVAKGIYIFMDAALGLHIQRVERVNQTQLQISNDNPKTNDKHPTGIVEEADLEFVGFVRANISTF